MTQGIPTLWRNPAFLLLVSGHVISLLGSGATTIGLALFTYRFANPSAASMVIGQALVLRILAFLLFLSIRRGSRESSQAKANLDRGGHNSIQTPGIH